MEALHAPTNDSNEAAIKVLWWTHTSLKFSLFLTSQLFAVMCYSYTFSFHHNVFQIQAMFRMRNILHIPNSHLYVHTMFTSINPILIILLSYSYIVALNLAITFQKIDTFCVSSAQVDSNSSCSLQLSMRICISFSLC